MELTSFFKLISDYGTLVILGGIFIWVIYRQIKIRLKKEENQVKLEEEKEKKINDLIYDALKHHMFNKDIDRESDENSCIDAKINDLLTELLKYTKSDRVVLFTYHNGGCDYMGRSFQRMSCTNESVRPGLAPYQQKYQNFFRTFLMALNNGLVNNNFFYLDDVEDIKEIDPSLYYYLRSRGSKNMYALGIKNENQKTIGFVSMSSTEDIEDLENAKLFLEETVHKIEGIYTIKNSIKQ